MRLEHEFGAVSKLRDTGGRRRHICAHIAGYSAKFAPINSLQPPSAALVSQITLRDVEPRSARNYSTHVPSNFRCIYNKANDWVHGEVTLRTGRQSDPEGRHGTCPERSRGNPAISDFAAPLTRCCLPRGAKHKLSLRGAFFLSRRILSGWSKTAANSGLITRHTMPSNFRRISNKTNDRGPYKVTHILRGRREPLVTHHYSRMTHFGYSSEPMHDLGFVREHPEVIEKMARDRGITLDLAPFRELDGERRKIITSTERMKAERNKASEEIARLKKAGAARASATLSKGPADPSTRFWGG